MLRKGRLHVPRPILTLSSMLGGALIAWLLSLLVTNIDLLINWPGSQFHSIAGVKGYANDLAFTPDGKQLVVGTMGDGAQLLSFPGGKLLRTFDEGFVFRLALSPDGQLLATRSPDNRSLKLWRVSDGRLLQTLQQNVVWAMEIEFSPKGDVLAVAEENKVSLFSVNNINGRPNLHLIHTLDTDKSDILAYGLSFSPDGQTLAVGGADKVGLWSIPDGKLFHTFPGHGISIAFSPDGQWVAVPDSVHSNNINLWRVSDGTRIRTLTEDAAPADFRQVHSLAVSPDGSALATGNIDNKVRIWRTANGSLTETLDLGSNDTGESIVFSPDGHTLVVGAYKRVKIHTLANK